MLAAVTIAAWVGCTERDQGDASEESGVGPGEAGYCWKECEAAVDCCAILTDGTECYAMNGDIGINRFVCNAGLCDFGGCESDQECSSTLGNSDYVCHATTDGAGLCAVPCTSDDDCSGVASGDYICGELYDGFAACTPAPCQVDADCGADFFQCMDGDCVFVQCMTDDDCTDGGSCNENHECRCTHTSECRGALDCIPVPT